MTAIAECLVTHVATIALRRVTPGVALIIEHQLSGLLLIVRAMHAAYPPNPMTSCACCSRSSLLTVHRHQIDTVNSNASLVQNQVDLQWFEGVQIDVYSLPSAR